jgi:1-acyl-sn-glycerol-3-phosphate acyltransferase
MIVRRLSRILVYTISMYLVTHLIVFFFLFPIGAPLIIFDSSNAHRIKKSVTRLLFIIIGQRLKVLGLENLEPGKNYLIVSNYPGSYAGFALMNVFPEASMLVHSFLSKVPIVGFLLKSTGATFVQRKRFGRTKHAIDETLKHIEKKSIIILPEGGRSPDGRIRKFKRGFIYILRHSSMDLLPVTLRGFYGLKPMKRVYLDPDSDLEVVIHRPINHSVVESLNDEVLLKLTVDTIEGAYKP